MDNSGDVSMPDVVDGDGNAVFAPYWLLRVAVLCRLLVEMVNAR